MLSPGFASVSKFVQLHEVWELERFQTAKVTFKVIQEHWQWMVSFAGPHTISYWTLIETTSLSCTVFEMLSLISQNWKRSRDPGHIPFGGNLSLMHLYTSVSISTRHLKCLLSPTPKMWLGAKFKKTGHVTLTTPISG